MLFSFLSSFAYTPSVYFVYSVYDFIINKIVVIAVIHANRQTDRRILPLYPPYAPLTWVTENETIRFSVRLLITETILQHSRSFSCWEASLCMRNSVTVLSRVRVVTRDTDMAVLSVVCLSVCPSSCHAVLLCRNSCIISSNFSPSTW